jgi:hypothetical protein
MDQPQFVLEAVLHYHRIRLPEIYGALGQQANQLQSILLGPIF